MISDSIYTSLDAADQTWWRTATVSQKHSLLQAFSGSQFILDACIATPGLVAELAEQSVPLIELSKQHESALSERLETCDNEDNFYPILRQYRRRHMVNIAYRDIENLQSIESSLKQVSALADGLIMSAYNWLYRQACKRYGTPENQQQLCIIAMGKLGGCELNFSSDVDLIFAYPSRGETQGARKAIEHQVFFTRLAQRLIAALDKITADGQVYRIDMRLRPFGDSGPLVTHFDAFTDYYLQQAREWERFALVKGRILNPESTDTLELQSILKPFIFKRYLDFTTLDALLDMKLKIDADARRRQLENNIKLGQGGIREAEFIVQSFQMIHGGRQPQLQQHSWLSTLDTIVQLEHMKADSANELKNAYLYLRKVEHALQQKADQQTQTLPDSQSDWELLALSCNESSMQNLKQRIAKARDTIHQQFETIFNKDEKTPDQDSSKISTCQDIWRGNYEIRDIVEHVSAWLDDDQTQQTFAKSLIEFKQSASKAYMTNRAEQLLDKLVPLILHDMLHMSVHSHKPVHTVFNLLGALLGRTTYLDMLLGYHQVRERLLWLAQKSPWIVSQLKRFPMLLDELLSGNYMKTQEIDKDACRQDYDDELRQALLRVEDTDEEHYLDTLRQFKLCQQFRIAASDLYGSLPIAKVSDNLTSLAEVLVTNVVEMAYKQMVMRYGTPNHCERPLDSFAAIAYGKMGGFELGYGSDLDLVFVHNAPQDSQTTGKKAISGAQFYIKVAQRTMHLLTTKTMLGELYDTDLRLRPSGNAGLLCCHLSGFEHYQLNEAWTWEHQALVRTRLVYGNSDLTNQFEKIRRNTLALSRDLKQLASDVSDMRTKLYEHHKHDHSNLLKHGLGGITDIEFIAQYIVLANAHSYPSLTDWPDNLRIIETAVNEQLLTEEQGKQLIDAYLEQRHAIHTATLSQEEQLTLTALSATLRESQENVKTIWEANLPLYIRDTETQTPYQ